MEDFSTEELRERMESLMRVFECGVCLEIVRPDMEQCKNGHLVCSDCMFGLGTCPTCRASFSDEKPPRIIVESVEALPARCKYSGCSVYLKRVDDHEKYCSFAEASCKICEWSEFRGELIDHCLAEHNTLTIGSKSKKGVVERFNYKEFFLETLAILIDDLFFWMDLRNDPTNKTFTVVFVPVPLDKPDKKVFVKLFLGLKGGTQFMCRIELDSDPDVSTSEKNYISMPWDFLPNLVNPEGDLPYTVYLSTEEL